MMRGCATAAESLQYFLETAATLGPKLGVLLFQLPPFFKKDLAVLDEFLTGFPAGTRAAFEFRHGSWLSSEVFERLQARNLALCVADSEKSTTPVEITADYGYFRLRDEGYTPRRHRAVGTHDRGEGGALPRGLRLLQARGSGDGPAVRAPAVGCARGRG